MDKQTLLDNLLALPEEQLEAFLHTHQADLTTDVMDELEARINQLRLQDPNEALRIAEIMLLAAGCFPDERVYANSLRLKGNLFIHFGRYEESISCYEAAKPIRIRHGESLEVARLQVGWTAALKNLARYDEALPLALATRKTLLEHEKWNWLANLEMNIGSIYRLTEHYDEALAIYEQGRQHFELAGNPVGAAQIQVNASYLMSHQDRFREAQVLLHKVRTVFERHEKWLPLARTDLNLAILCFRLGRYQEAWEKFNQARDEFKPLSEKIIGLVDIYRSYLYLSLNLFPEALNFSQNAQKIFFKKNMPYHVAWADFIQAVVYRQIGEEEEALRFFQKAHSFFSAHQDSIWVGLIDLQRAALLRETDRQSEAILLIEQAIQRFAAHKLNVRQAQARLLLAECYYDMQQPAHARPLYEAILTMPDEFCLPTLAYRAHYGLGRVAEAEGDKKALDFYQAAIKEIEAIRHNLRVDEFKASFLDDKLALYQAAVRLSVEMEQVADAFDYVEQAKSSALLDLLARNLESRAEEGALVDREAWERLRGLKEQWLWHHSKLEAAPVEGEEQTRWTRGMRDEAWEELASIEKELNQLWRQVQGRHIKSLTAEAKHAWQAVSEFFDSETVLVEYFFIEDEVLAFLLRRNDLQVVEDFPYTRREIERSLYALDVALKGLSGLNATYVKDVLTPLARRHLNWLYNALIAPLMPTLKEYGKVVIVPDDLLYALPFHALHDGQQYLIDCFEIHYAPSASVLALCHQTKASKQKNNPSTLVPEPVEGRLAQDGASSGHGHQRLPFPPGIGGDGGGAALVIGYSHDGELPHVTNEVKTIASTFPSAQLFEEEDATIVNLRQHVSDCHLLHLASHAIFREDNPLFSSLLLADEPLNVIDIYHLELNASLVTLSACETGINQLTGGDLFGLARGCFYAGAPSLVASLWRVDDASTALLMRTFYQRLQAGEPIARALRAAQLTLRQIEREEDGQLIRPYDHPHYWAPFFLMGADGVL